MKVAELQKLMCVNHPDRKASFWNKKLNGPVYGTCDECNKVNEEMLRKAIANHH
jgi:hypothetical protein